MSARASSSGSGSRITTQSNSFDTPKSVPRRRRAHQLLLTNEPGNVHSPAGHGDALDITSRSRRISRENETRLLERSDFSSSSTLASFHSLEESLPQEELPQRSSRFSSSSAYPQYSRAQGRAKWSKEYSTSRGNSYEGCGSNVGGNSNRPTVTHRMLSGASAQEEVERTEKEQHFEDLENPIDMEVEKLLLESENPEIHSGSRLTTGEELRNDEEEIDLTTAVVFGAPSESTHAQHSEDAKEDVETDKSVAIERMKYNAPEDPRNYVINMIVNSASGSVTLDFIHDALQWEEHYEEVYGTVFDYLQGYQLIFAISPIDSRVTLRRPPLTKKGPRTGRWQKRGEQLVADHIGSVSYSYVGGSFDLDVLSSRYKRRGYNAEMIYDVLHVWTHRIFDLFLFSNGVVVWWGLNRRDHWIVEDDFLTAKNSFVSDAVKDRHIQEDIDELFPIWCSYELDESKKNPLSRFAAYLCFDHYLIPVAEPTRTHVMLTVSYSLSRSAVVDFFEYVTQWSQKRVLALPSELRGFFEYFSTNHRILKLEGELLLAFMGVMALRGTPSFLWEMSWLEDYYELIEKHTSSEGRLSWFSARSEALLQQLSNIKNRRFCIFILGSDVFLIFLLVTDVVLIMAHFFFKLYFKQEHFAQ